MRALLVCVLLALSAAVPAAAQVFLGAEVGPDAFTRGDDAKIDTDGEDAFAWALSVEVSSASLYTVFESTAPEREILKYLRQGIYRQELAAMLLMSESVRVPFRTLAADLAKAGSFRALAKKHKADAMALFEAGGRLKEAADLRLPLFLLSTSTSGAAAYEAASSTAPPRTDAEKK
ncbi:MAG: hypothetical protein A2081_02350 [Elusimicrobia bacterium GWC2_61_19]|nr:MAG: hypothetical protein A2081_02350 [Elusimicrobia bacterium GWC2_61_19]